MFPELAAGVYELLLDDNQINMIYDGAFDGLRQLQILGLRNNSIRLDTGYK